MSGKWQQLLVSNVAGQWSAPTFFSISATPPQAISIVNVVHAKHKITSFTIVFNEALQDAQAASAAFSGYFQVDPGTRKKTKIVYRSHVPGVKATYADGSQRVTIRLAKPLMGPIKIVVLPGVVATDGVSNTISKTFSPVN